MTSQHILGGVDGCISYPSLIECDVCVPEALCEHFAEMQPVFKNIRLTRDDLGPFMRRYAEENNIMATQRRMLVDSYRGDKILLAAPLLEWHASSGVVYYIYLDSPELLAQQRYVVYVSEMDRHHGAVSSANRVGAQQRCHIITDDARLHNVRVDVDGMEPMIHVDRVIAFFTEGVRSIRTVRNHGGRWCDTLLLLLPPTDW